MVSMDMDHLELQNDLGFVVLIFFLHFTTSRGMLVEASEWNVFVLPFPLSLSNFTCNGPLTLLLDRIDVTFPLLISFDIQIHMTTTPCYGKQNRQSRIAMRHGRRL